MTTESSVSRQGARALFSAALSREGEHSACPMGSLDHSPYHCPADSFVDVIEREVKFGWIVAVAAGGAARAGIHRESYLPRVSAMTTLQGSRIREGRNTLSG